MIQVLTKGVLNYSSGNYGDHVQVVRLAPGGGGTSAAVVRAKLLASVNA